MTGSHPQNRYPSLFAEQLMKFNEPFLQYFNSVWPSQHPSSEMSPHGIEQKYGNCPEGSAVCADVQSYRPWPVAGSTTQPHRNVSELNGLQIRLHRNPFSHHCSVVIVPSWVSL